MPTCVHAMPIVTALAGATLKLRKSIVIVKTRPLHILTHRCEKARKEADRVYIKCNRSSYENLSCKVCVCMWGDTVGVYGSRASFAYNLNAACTH